MSNRSGQDQPPSTGPRACCWACSRLRANTTEGRTRGEIVCTTARSGIISPTALRSSAASAFRRTIRGRLLDLLVYGRMVPDRLTAMLADGSHHVAEHDDGLCGRALQVAEPEADGVSAALGCAYRQKIRPRAPLNMLSATSPPGIAAAGRAGADLPLQCRLWRISGHRWGKCLGALAFRHMMIGGWKEPRMRGRTW